MSEHTLASIPTYIEQCDFTIVLAPGCTHFDRIDPLTQRKVNLCYRTYRLQARCVFEMFCAFLRTTDDEIETKPTLLVRSGTGTPCWISPLECQKLALGHSVFECCEENHATQPCLRPQTLDILHGMIERRAHSLFVWDQNESEARFTLCLQNYWCRGFNTFSKKTWSSLNAFKDELRWDDDLPDNVALLCYASACDCVNVVHEILRNTSEVSVRVPKEGINVLGIPGHATPLLIAMCFSTFDTVQILLEHGADPHETDTMGNDAICAALLGRTSNIKSWLRRFSNWHLDQYNHVLETYPFSYCIYLGPRRLELVKDFLERGVSPLIVSGAGSNGTLIFIFSHSNKITDQLSNHLQP